MARKMLAGEIDPHFQPNDFSGQTVAEQVLWGGASSRSAEIVRMALERTPPELASDIVDRGIVMTGGGALLKGLDSLLRENTSLPINVDEEPLTCVVRGTGRILDDPEKYRGVLTLSRH